MDRAIIAQTPAVLAGQALVAGFPGTELPPELRKAAGRGELGGFVLFKRNLGEPEAQIETTAELCADLIASCPEDLPPFLAVDQEGGRVQRLGRPVVQLPPMRALGRLDDLALTERAAALLGRQLAALGFNLDFAPVLDVDSNPHNPVIGDRSFGSEPERVARHGLAFARGLQGAGVLACGKHFPGHGDTAQDSHLALPRLDHELARLHRIELAPFRATLTELPTLMTAHIVFGALDAERPATLSRAVITDLLRGQLGYRGVVFSDDLEMKAISDHYGVAEAACEAIGAGCDALLVCREPELCLQAHEALARRAEREPAFAQRLADAATRSLALRRRFAPSAERPARIRERLQAHDPLAMEALLASRLESP
jgi:beta-N-acetylhexosaminidase